VDQLLAQGCDCAQGYFLSRPMPPDQFKGWIEQHGTAPDRPVSALADVNSLLWVV
jgi:sensor c-di-GMP phosphodiesterase-like protein